MNILNTNSSRQEHLYSWLKLLLNIVIPCAYDEDVGGGMGLVFVFDNKPFNQVISVY